MKNRVEGQIWIDRNSPNRLKYYVNGEEFETNVAQNFEGQTGIVKGSVVKLENGKLAKAGFPDDIEKIIGVAGQTYSTSRTYLPVIQTDSIIFDASEVSAAFVDLDEVIADWGTDTNKGIGAPIYWFIGRTKNVSGSYTYTDSFDSSYKGKLTLNTPSGYQWKVESYSDESLNVGYDNLPIVGRVASYTISNGAITSLTMNTNYFGFDREMHWTWPYVGAGLKAPTNNKVSIPIRHGLFANTIDTSHDVQIKPRCFCDVIALEQNNDTEYEVSCIVDNFYGITEQEEADTDKRTYIEMHTGDTYRYNIHGTIVYKFSKE